MSKALWFPNTNGQKGVKAAAAIGAFGGDEAAVLEVIAHISNGVKEKLPEYIDALDFKLLPLETTEALDFIITVFVKNILCSCPYCTGTQQYCSDRKRWGNSFRKSTFICCIYGYTGLYFFEHGGDL